MTNPYDKGPIWHKIPREFLFRRLQSFSGLLFLLFLIEHLFTNSQATFAVGDDGKGFISMVNGIHSLPYLTVLEWLFVGIPILIHGWWGILKMREAKLNSMGSNGTTPELGSYPRNQAFTWQRITGGILVIAIGLHVYYMRFLHQPEHIEGVTSEYFVTVTEDPGLAQVASRLHVELTPKNEGVVTARADSIGAAFLLVLRDTYKSIPMAIAYSLFVFMAVFHGCNGLWTFSITWGIALSERGRTLVRIFSNGLMLLLLFLGLSCIWGVYWVNLRY